MQAIYGAIKGANTVIFVLTPDSLTSVVCGREIAHAVSHNKRIVPLVARGVSTETVPEALAKLNWIFCRHTDDFEEATATLITALDTDLSWLRAHTRLLTRAIAGCGIWVPPRLLRCCAATMMAWSVRYSAPTAGWS